MKNIKQYIYSLSLITLALVFAIGVSIAIAAWSGPTQDPPLGNVDTPVNVGGSTQYKSGALGIGGLFRAYATAIFDGNVGIGTVSPSQKLDVDGGIEIGNTSNETAGAIRFTGSDFEGYDGTEWKLLTASSVTESSYCSGMSDPAMCDSCIADGGDWQNNQSVCYFATNAMNFTNLACPSGWSMPMILQSGTTGDYIPYTSTKTGKCKPYAWSCITGSHSRTDAFLERCDDGGDGGSESDWCYASYIELGCIKN